MSLYGICDSGDPKDGLFMVIEYCGGGGKKVDKMHGKIER